MKWDLNKFKFVDDTILPKQEIPNVLTKGFEKNAAGLWVMPETSSAGWGYYSTGVVAMLNRINKVYGIVPEDIQSPVEPEFETNLTEALVGWKAWCFGDDDNKLRSAQQSGFVWEPLKAAEATCTRDATWRGGKSNHPDVVLEHCTCGIYATDDRDGTDNYNDDEDDFVGLIYGWGRYIRGERGWRAQYAYPKAFHLKSHQINFVDALREFRVPIRIDQPVDIYNPEEDGYHGHRHDETDWNFGAVADSDSTED